MANLIQIKRSLNTATPSSLANGELAYTANGDVLFIGSNGNVEAVGGKRTPGTLTANQALVANSTSGIDKVVVANLVPTQIYANGSFGSAGQVLTSNGSTSYWTEPFTGNIQNLTAGDGLVSNSTGIHVLANSGIIANSTGTFVDDASLSIATSQLTGDVTLGTQTSGNYVATITAGAGISGSSSTEGGTPTIAVVPNTGIIANSSGVFVDSTYISSIDANNATYLNGQLASYYTNYSDTAAATAYSNATSYADTAAATAYTNATSYADTAAATAYSNAVSFANTAAGTAYSNATSYADTAAATAYSNATSYADTAAGTAYSNAIAYAASNTYVNSTFAPLASPTFTGTVTVSGNLDINGTLTTIDATNLSVNDSIIELGRNNSADTLDIGFYGTYNDGVEKYTGLIWDTSTDKYELFHNTQTEPTTTLNTSGTGYTTATLKAFLESGALISNSSVVNITANSTVSVALTANTLSLTSALPGTSGGTGLSSYTNQDLLVANSSNGFTALGVGSEGYVLQVSSGTVSWGTLDGGTF